MEIFEFFGCGNTFKCAVRSTEDDSGFLVYWAQNLGVDGFRFDLASILERDPNGNFHQGSELLWELKNDPELAGIKMIAEPGMPLEDTVSGIPQKMWAGLSGMIFRDTVRKAVRGDEGK